jgi:hypothetical protein
MNQIQQDLFNKLDENDKNNINLLFNDFQKDVFLEILEKHTKIKEENPNTFNAGIKTCLWIDKGEGKTRTSIVSALALVPHFDPLNPSHVNNKILIVCSKSVVNVWRNELMELFGKDVRYFYYHTEEKGCKDEDYVRNMVMSNQIILTTKEMIGKHFNQKDPNNLQLNMLISKSNVKIIDACLENINDLKKEIENINNELKEIDHNLTLNIDQDRRNDLCNRGNFLVETRKGLSRKTRELERKIEIQETINREIKRMPNVSTKITSNATYYNRHPRPIQGFGPIFGVNWGALIVDEYTDVCSLSSNIGQALLLVPAAIKFALSGTLLDGASPESLLAYHLFIEDEDFPNNKPMATAYKTKKTDEEQLNNENKQKDDIKNDVKDLLNKLIISGNINDTLNFIFAQIYPGVKRNKTDLEIIKEWLNLEEGYFIDILNRLNKKPAIVKAIKTKYGKIRKAEEAIEFSKGVVYNNKPYGGFKRTTIYRPPRSAEERGLLKPIKETILVGFSKEEEIVYLVLKKMLMKIDNDIQNNKDIGQDTTQLRGLRVSLLTYLRHCIISPFIPLSKIVLSAAIVSEDSLISREIVNEFDRPEIKEWSQNSDNALSMRIKKMIELANRHAKVVVFSDSRVAIDLILYKTRGWRNILTLESSMNVNKRNEILKQFEQLNECVMILSYDIGGHGIQLQSAEAVILLDYSWSNADSEQAIARVYRQGQKKRVSVYYIVSNSALEKAVLKKHLDKEILKDELSEGSSSSKVTTIKIDEIIRVLNDKDADLTCELSDILSKNDDALEKRKVVNYGQAEDQGQDDERVIDPRRASSRNSPNSNRSPREDDNEEIELSERLNKLLLDDDLERAIRESRQIDMTKEEKLEDDRNYERLYFGENFDNPYEGMSAEEVLKFNSL